MAHVWNILNTIQIVNTFPLFSILVPENVKKVLVSFNSIANLKIIPKDEIYDALEKLFEPIPISRELAKNYSEASVGLILEEIQEKEEAERQARIQAQKEGKLVEDEETLETKTKKDMVYEEFDFST